MNSVVIFVAVFMVACQANPLEAEGRDKRQVVGEYAGARCVGPLCPRSFGLQIGRQFGCINGGNCPIHNPRGLAYDNYNDCPGGNCQGMRPSEAYDGEVRPTYGNIDGGYRSFTHINAPKRVLGLHVTRNIGLAYPRSFDHSRTRRSADPCVTGYCGYNRMYGYQQPMYAQMQGISPIYAQMQGIPMNGVPMPIYMSQGCPGGNCRVA